MTDPLSVARGETEHQEDWKCKTSRQNEDFIWFVLTFVPSMLSGVKTCENCCYIWSWFWHETWFNVCKCNQGKSLQLELKDINSVLTYFDLECE